MSHIKRVLIHKLLGRRDPLDINLNEDINILFGENGSGKTTILKILESALTLDGVSMHSIPVDRAEVWIYSEDNKDTYQYLWERKIQIGDDRIERLMNRKDNPYLNYLEDFNQPNINSNKLVWKLISKNGKSSKQINRWKHEFLPATRLHFGGTSKSIRSTKFSDTELDGIFEDLIKKSWTEFSSQTLKKVSEIQNNGLKHVLYQGLSSEVQNNIEVIRDPLASYERVKGFLGRQGKIDAEIFGDINDFTNRYQNDLNVRRIVDTLNKVEDQIDLAMKPLENFKMAINGLFSRGKKINANDNELKILLEDKSEISIANLSAGEKHLVKILLTAMMAGNGVVLIDEPELSMHIDWQRILIARIKAINPLCQLICASHSPEVMAEISDEKIFKI